MCSTELIFLVGVLRDGKLLKFTSSDYGFWPFVRMVSPE